jgi:hypothetical protein
MKRVNDENGKPLILISEGKNKKTGETVVYQKYLYKAINTLGDTFRANEFYDKLYPADPNSTLMQASALDNGYMKVEQRYDPVEKKHYSAEVEDAKIHQIMAGEKLEGPIDESEMLAPGELLEDYNQQIRRSIENDKTNVSDVPQNKISGVESYGSLVIANAAAIKALGPNPHSIDMIEAGLRTRTTRSADEMSKYKVKVGSIIKNYGKSADGTTKTIYAEVTAIHPKDSPGWKGTWEKEGWRAEDVNVIDKFSDGAAAIEFKVRGKVTPVNKNINFQEDQSYSYYERTVKNASADATIALAVDFTSSGEKLTKNSVLNQNKKYISVDANKLTVTPERVNGIVNQLNSVNAKTLNIAGNGIYTVSGKYTQLQIDNFTYDLLNQILNSPNLKTKVESIRTGGQTGFDEAGAKAGIRLGIPTTILAPKGWKFRNIKGQDISSESSFKNRFNSNFETTKTLKDGITYTHSQINSKMLTDMGYSPNEIGKILKLIC